MNALMTRLSSDYSALSTRYDDLLTRSATRALSVAEMAELDQVRLDMDTLGERLIQLRTDDDRRWTGHDFMARHEPVRAPQRSSLPGLEVRSAPASVVRIRGEATTYAPPDARGGPRVSFFRDLMHAQIDGDRDARARVERHQLETRAVGTSGTSPGVVPPTWLFEEFAILAHYSRPWADTLRRVQLENANPVNIGTQTAGAAVTAQPSEGTVPNDGSFVAGIIATQPKTLTGKVDVSRQLVDGSSPAIDSLVYADAMGSYNEAVESAVAAAFEALTPPATITYPGTAPAYANIFDAIIDAGASVRKHRKSQAQAVLCSDGAWAYLAKEKDTVGRPLMTTGDYGPTNAMGVGQAAQWGHVAGEVVGLLVIPSWAGTDNHLHVAKADDLLLLESSTFNFRYEEVLGPETIRLGVWGYAAPVLGRYATSTVLIDAGSTIPAPTAGDPAEAQRTSKR
jgi:HK97 family phage major capsid protein